jgi:hypothetical protein
MRASRLLLEEDVDKVKDTVLEVGSLSLYIDILSMNVSTLPLREYLRRRTFGRLVVSSFSKHGRKALIHSHH